MQVVSPVQQPHLAWQSHLLRQPQDSFWQPHDFCLQPQDFSLQPQDFTLHPHDFCLQPQDFWWSHLLQDQSRQPSSS
jgi:hypothetical protein